MAGTNGSNPRIARIQPPSVEELQETFEAVRDANQDRLTRLGQMGAAMDPLSFLHARIDALIESISRFAGPNGPRWAATARLEFEQMIADQLDQIEREATKAQLAAGAGWTPAMIAELARATGLFKHT